MHVFEWTPSSINSLITEEPTLNNKHRTERWCSNFTTLTYSRYIIISPSIVSLTKEMLKFQFRAHFSKHDNEEKENPNDHNS